MTRINPLPNVPLHEQLADTLRRQIARGEFRTDEQLPPAQHMARRAGVHHNTVLKAYRLLAAEGLIDLRRARGATVLAAPAFHHLDELVEQTLDEAARQNLTLGALLAHISAAAARR